MFETFSFAACPIVDISYSSDTRFKSFQELDLWTEKWRATK